jgi:O-antigen/teichoic acid export membrane protein
MLRRFLRDSALYSASAVLSRGIGIILLPLYTRFLHPAEYGALDLLMVFATLANYLISLEISQGVARVYAEAKTVEEKRSCVSSAAWFATAAYGLFAIFASIFPVHIAKWLLGSTHWADAAQAMIFAVATNGVFFMLQDLLRWQLQPLRHAVANCRRHPGHCRRRRGFRHPLRPVRRCHRRNRGFLVERRRHPLAVAV